MKLSEHTTPDLILPDLNVSDKTDVIKSLVDIIANRGAVGDRDLLMRAVVEREMQRTTGIGRGFAVPHAKSSAIPRMVIAFGRPRTPVDFAAIDGKPVKLIALLASPLVETSNHIQALAKLSRLVMSEKILTALLSAPDANAFYQVLADSDKNL